MELTGRDVRALTTALQPAVDGKVQKVYGTDRFALVLDLYARDLPQRYLYVELPSLVFLSSDKVVMPDKPPGLVQRIRGQLQGLRIEAIEQHGMDRILILRLVGRRRFSLVIELFAKGNIIVLDENGIIRNLAVKESYGSRDVRPGAEYVFPPSSGLDIDDLENAIPRDKHLVAAIASAGFGGAAAQRILEPLVDDVAHATLDDLPNVDALRSALIAERDADRFTLIKDRIVSDPDGVGILELLESSADLSAAPVEQSERKVTASRTERAIEIQSKRLESLKDRRSEDLRRGELLFEHYQTFEAVLSFASEYRKKHGSLEGLESAWPESFPKLVSFDKKGVNITVDVETVK